MYNYNESNTQHFFNYDIKPEKYTKNISALEKDVVIGTFTHVSTYFPKLLESANKYLPHIPFITVLKEDNIRNNMNLLREAFLKTNKRYWVYLDHDVQFLNSDIINNALKILIKNKAGIVTTYMKFNPKILSTQYNTKNLIEHQTTWAVGYFIMIDSFKLGHQLTDINLPCPNTGIDISYSMEARISGYEIWACPDCIYHAKKNTPVNIEMANKTHKYLLKKWGTYYIDGIQPLKTILD